MTLQILSSFEDIKTAGQNQLEWLANGTKRKDQFQVENFKFKSSALCIVSWTCFRTWLFKKNLLVHHIILWTLQKSIRKLKTVKQHVTVLATCKKSILE